MSSVQRYVAAIIATPVVVAARGLTPVASAWGQGGTYSYTGGGRAQTFFSGTRNLTSYVVMNSQDGACHRYTAEYKRHRTLQPSQLLMSTFQYSGCVFLEDGRHLSLGQQSTFGNFSTPLSSVRNVKFIVTGSGA